MKNVVLKSNLILIFTLSLFLSCKQTITNKNENKFKFVDFYEKIDSIKLNQKSVFIEKLYTKKDIKYLIRLSNNKRFIIPFGWNKIQPSSFELEKVTNDIFKINFMLGNATFYDYFFNVDKDNELNFLKINSTYNYSIRDSTITDSIILNKKNNNLNKSDIQKIRSFINKH